MSANCRGAAPYDIIVGYDGGPITSVSYGGITSDNVGCLIDGAVFTRGPSPRFANYPFESSRGFPRSEPNPGLADHSRLSCSAGDTQLGAGFCRESGRDDVWT